jgi:hypothetical protein
VRCRHPSRSDTTALADQFRLEDVPDDEFEVGAIKAADVQFGKELAFMFDTNQDAESTLDVDVVPSTPAAIAVAVDDVDGRARPDIGRSRLII